MQTIDQAIDRLTELSGELTRQTRLEKAHSVQLAIEALKRLQELRSSDLRWFDPLLPGETKK